MSDEPRTSGKEQCECCKRERPKQESETYFASDGKGGVAIEPAPITLCTDCREEYESQKCISLDSDEVSADTLWEMWEWSEQNGAAEPTDGIHDEQSRRIKAEQLLTSIHNRLACFEARCEQDEYTDTDEVWELLYAIDKDIADCIGVPLPRPAQEG